MYSPWVPWFDSRCLVIRRRFVNILGCFEIVSKIKHCLSRFRSNVFNNSIMYKTLVFVHILRFFLVRGGSLICVLLKSEFTLFYHEFLYVDSLCDHVFKGAWTLKLDSIPKIRLEIIGEDVKLFYFKNFLWVFGVQLSPPLKKCEERFSNFLFEVT